MGRNPSPLVVVASMCVALAVSVEARGVPQEPYWNSRPLSFWLQALATTERSRRIEAAQSVAEIALAHGGRVVAPAIPVLVTSLTDPDVAVRQSAARALEQIGPPARNAVPALIRMMADDGVADLRRGAGLALGRIDPKIPEVVRQAARSLADHDTGVRVSAAVLLVSSGPAAAAVPDALSRALEDPDPMVRLYAAAAIGQAGDPARAVSLVLPVLKAPDLGLRVESAGLLVDLAGDRPGVVKALEAALADDEPQVRAAAADALARIGYEARPALDTLWSMLRDPDETVRESVLRAALTIKESRDKR